MKPLKLTLQAFGPYADKTVIDYSAMKDNGIYLITGDTGAGKTTIFDGICYALYDRTSGNIRTAESLRSKYAESDTATEVRFEFLYDGRKYEILRSPAYDYVNRNGNISKKAPVSELITPDGKVFTRKKEVDQKIVEILGLDYEQFKRIVMIAQNDFLELLLDKGDKRIEIFRKIFSTSYYLRFQDQLWEMQKELSQKMSNGNSSVSQYLNSCITSENNPLKNELDKMQNQLPEFSVIEEVMQKIIQEDTDLLNDLQKKTEELNKRISTVNQTFSLSQKQADNRTELNRLNKDFQTLSEQLESLKKAETEKAKNQEFIDQSAKKISLLEADYTRYDQLDDLSTKLMDLKKESDTLILKKNTLSKQLNSTHERIQIITDQLAAMESAEVELLKNQQLLSDCQQLYKKIESAESKYKEYNRLCQNNASAESNYLTQDKNYQDKEQKYQESYRLFLASQAGILASKLIEHQPCPVCGSTDHPAIAHMNESNVSEQMLEALKKDSEMANKLLLEAGKKFTQAHTEMENSRQFLKEILKELFSSELDENTGNLITKRKDEIIRDGKELRNKVETLNSQVKLKKQLNEEMAELNKMVTQNEPVLNETEKQIVANNTQIIKAEEDIQNLKKTLVFNSKKEAANEKNNLEKLILKLKAEMEAAVKAVQNTKDKLILVQGQITSVRKELEEHPAMELGECLKLKQETEIAQKAHLSEVQTVSSRLTINRDNLNRMMKVFSELKETERKLQTVDSLCRTARGKLSGKAKIDFETYIQMTYFDRILYYANKRLKVMSDGQYTFKRGEIGLALNVIDHTNGTEREVSTLSGGESFKASLSLALGLSDEVQSKTSSVHIDTMFVDEGFGTLDDDSLSKAISVLMDLSNNQRSIGIISHVKELQDKIEQKIIVRKNSNGSSSITILTE